MSKITKIRLSGQTYTIEDSSALHNLDSIVTSDGSNAVASSGIYSAITAATNALAESIAEQGYQTSGDVQNAISGKAEASDVQSLSGTVTAHTANTDIHVTTEDKTAWNAKADISDIPSVSGYADSVKYNSTSHHVEFYHGTTAGTKVFEYDASPFLIDGMVQNVEIKNVTSGSSQVTCLVVSFNTDAGKQDINIPISEIFDADNFYDKTEIDTIVSGINEDISAVNGDVATKQNTLTAGDGIQITNDVISVTGVPLTIDDTVTSGSANPVKSSGIYNFVTGETATKQDTLVSGTNIKTVGGETILGSGNVQTLHASIGTGDDAETLILELS